MCVIDEEVHGGSNMHVRAHGMIWRAAFSMRPAVCCLGLDVCVVILSLVPGTCVCSCVRVFVCVARYSLPLGGVRAEVSP